MNATAFSSSPWYQAATLTERLAALRVAGSPSTAAELQADLGQQELQRWRSQPPFGEDRFFEQRLAADGLTQQEMLRILGEPIQVVGERWPAPPDWLARMHQAFACPRPPETSPFSADEEAPEMAAFLDMIEPLITQGRQEVRHGAAALAGERLSVPFDPATVEEVLFKNLPWQLCRLMDRTLVLELHVARIQGLLQGETPSERFASFHERLRHPEPARAFLEEYPVLARQLVLAIDHWVRFSLEFLRHLAEDWDAIRELFHPSSDPGLLAEVEGNAGDSHRGGRAVLVARFASGFRLVYKPKSMAVDRHFQDLLAWVNERDDRLPFRILKILDLEDHGWVEFIEARSCSSTAEVERFYERQGGYLALLYALEAMDFHCENLIAAGEHPVLIDLEALFHPRTERPDLSHADAAAWDRITHSVLNVSLLPQRIWAGDDPQGVDISGIGAKGGQLTPHPVPQWEEVGTDAMRFTRQRVEMPADANRPLVGGADVEVMDYAEFIVKGFTRVYRLLERSRDELLADAGPLARFADDEVRVIMRATQLYSVLRSESFHPDVLRNALDRDRLFDRLWIGIDQNPNLARVIPSERDDLWQGDIPMFTT
ncbi:MAG: type 2 lantipeptide synthetase LanM, partial [Planctomycetes bacterium]|nr:type 2 lantipeptide synthetase LanM [Planctomycetota bacterium]